MKPCRYRSKPHQEAIFSRVSLVIPTPSRSLFSILFRFLPEWCVVASRSEKDSHDHRLGLPKIGTGDTARAMCLGSRDHSLDSLMVRNLPVRPLGCPLRRSTSELSPSQSNSCHSGGTAICSLDSCSCRSAHFHSNAP